MESALLEIEQGVSLKTPLYHGLEEPPEAFDTVAATVEELTRPLCDGEVVVDYGQTQSEMLKRCKVDSTHVYIHQQGTTLSDQHSGTKRVHVVIEELLADATDEDLRAALEQKGEELADFDTFLAYLAANQETLVNHRIIVSAKKAIDVAGYAGYPEIWQDGFGNRLCRLNFRARTWPKGIMVVAIRKEG